MNLQQVVQPKSSANGYGRRRVERESGSRMENKLHSGKSNSGRSMSTGAVFGSKVGGYGSSSRDRLVYLTTCLIGHNVEVQTKDGSIYSGIFHATNADKDFGIILKMARLTKDGSLRGQKAVTESVSKAPFKTLIIPAKDFVQVIAKDMSVTRDGLSNELQCETQQEIMLDSSISQTRHVEVGRELEPWVPDEDDPQCPELENIFDRRWNRLLQNWDQFETNETLFGVKSTFDEELYTTKLERGPQMTELEREAVRIAREIESEDTHDLHLAEERGIHFHEIFDIDEETRFSSVYRDTGVDDSGYDENEDILLDSRNTETFGGASDSVINGPLTDLTNWKQNGAGVSSSSTSMDEAQSSQSGTGMDACHSDYDQAKQLASELSNKGVPALVGESRFQNNLFSEHLGGNSDAKEFVEKQTLPEGTKLKSEGEYSLPSLNGKKDGSDKGGLSPNATAYAPSSRMSSKGHGKTSSDESEGPTSGKPQGETQSTNSRGRPTSSTSSTSDCVGAASASNRFGLSPSSSVGSSSSEKSTLNPLAKESKLNPHAKSFTPSPTSVRPPSPVSDCSFYLPSNVPDLPHMHGMPMGIGIGSSFTGHQPVIFNPQVPPMQSAQAYFHPNGPQHVQQMLLGHPRQVLYMPTYPPEMPYKGRDY